MVLEESNQHETIEGQTKYINDLTSEIHRMKSSLEYMNKRLERAKRHLQKMCTHESYTQTPDYEYHKPGHLYVCDICNYVMAKKPN